MTILASLAVGFVGGMGGGFIACYVFWLGMRIREEKADAAANQN